MSGLPTGWLLDLSRSASRVGRRVATGIDRVEAEWLDHLLAAPEPVFALVRAAPGFVLLDRAGMAGLRDRLRGAVAWGPPDAMARLHLRQSPARRQAMADLRRLACARVWGHGAKAVARVLRGHVPEGAVWLNLGHANLRAEVLAGLRSLPGLRAAVLVHDTIPLDHPGFASPGLPARFAEMLAVAGRADLLLCPSQATAEALRAHLHDPVPPIHVAPLGITRPRPAPASLPAPLAALADGTFFLALGTVEPRKNIGFLLDLWEGAARDGAPLPPLVIAGARGWAEPALFDRLAAGPLTARGVHWAPGLPDGAVAHLLARARALVHPSLAEGFGLPPAEATALGTPVIAHPLPALRETLGDYPVYLDVTASYAWSQAIRRLADGGPVRYPPPELPTWTTHFAAARRAIALPPGTTKGEQTPCNG